MRLTALAFVVVAAHLEVGADEVEPTQAVAALLAESPRPIEVCLEYSESLGARGNDGWSRTYKLAWKMRGLGADADIYCRRYPDPDNPNDYPHVKIRVADRGYYVVLSQPAWSSWSGSAAAVRIDTEGSILTYLQKPVEDGTWTTTLLNHPAVAAQIDHDDQLTVLLPFSPGGEQAIRESLPITGMLGWRCVLTRSKGCYELRTVEQLGTATIATSGDRGQLLWAPNPALLPGVPLSVWPGGVECGVTQRREFDNFIEIAGVRLPLRVTTRSATAVHTAEIDASTIGIVQAWPDTTFSFAPPPEFGPTGTHTDLVTGDTFVHGREHDPSHVVQSLVRSGADIKEAGDPGSRVTTLLSVVLPALLACIIGVTVWRWRRRDC